LATPATSSNVKAPPSLMGLESLGEGF
jgi:hypothetical protein